MGKPNDALLAIEKAIALDKTDLNFLAGRAGALLELGKTGEGHELLEEILPQVKEPIADSYRRACVHALLGNRERMIEELRIAKANNVFDTDWVCIDPDFKAYREDQEFLEITGCGRKQKG